MNAFFTTLLAILLVAAAFVVILKAVPKVLSHDSNSKPDTEDFENEVYTMKSSLPTLFKEYGAQSLKGLVGIFEFELHKKLFVFDDTLAQTLQIYDLGGGRDPRWTVLLPFQKDSCGKRFHPYIQFGEDQDGYITGEEYPIDYRTKYGKKVLFKDLPFDARIFILISIQAPIIQEYELGEGGSNA